MTAFIFSVTRQRISAVILLANLIGLAGCTQAVSNLTPASLPTMPPTLEAGQQLVEASDVTPTTDPATAASPDPTNTSGSAPTATPKTTNPTRRAPAPATRSMPAATSPSQATTEAPVQPAAVSTEPAATQVPTLVPSLPPLTVFPYYQTLPAGSSTKFSLDAEDPCVTPYTFQAQGLPVGVTAEFLGDAIPCRSTLVLHTVVTVAPGDYTVKVVATQTGTSLSKSAQVTLSVTSCSEFPQGEFTQAIQSNFITLITAGKPAIEHGLLVPLQVCQNHSLRVTLTAAVSEAGTPMATPPRFYLYRSLVWPAPSAIAAHNWGQNVRPQRNNSDGWLLQADITPGLYLLVFERDYWKDPPDTDPASFPATVTYRLEAAP